MRASDLETAALRELAQIRRIVESSGRFTLLSGSAAIVAGVAALLGSLATQGVLRRAGGLAGLTDTGLVAAGRIWLGVLVVAFVALCAGTRARARRDGRELVPRVLARVAFGLLPSCLVGLALTFALVRAGAVERIAPVWILCYGAAAVTAGLFSVRSIQVLGALFMVWGLITLVFLIDQPALSLGLSFGGLHVAYGLFVVRGHGA